MAKNKTYNERTAPIAMIIDGDNLAHAAFHSYKRLSYKGQSTSVLFGLPKMIHPLVAQMKPDHLTIVWDGVKHPKRVELCPTYKMHREETRDPVARKNYLDQKKKVMKLFRYLGIPQAYDPNIEGDDMIYLVNKKMLAKGYDTKIVSGDKDMEQMISKYTSIYNHREKITLMPGLLYEAYRGGLKHNQIVDYLCLTGDSSDDIPGYKGVGHVTALKLLTQFQSIESFLNSSKSFGSIDKEKLLKLYRVNKQMIDLALFNKRHNKGVRVTFYMGKSKPKMKREKYIQTCASYGLKTLITNQFINQFHNEGSTRKN